MGVVQDEAAAGNWSEIKDRAPGRYRDNQRVLVHQGDAHHTDRARYGVLLVDLENIRRGRGKLKPTDYAGTAYHLAMLSAAARGTLGLATAAWFVLLILVSLLFAGVWDTWLVEFGLALGWTAALGVLVSLLRMGAARLLERRVGFLMRSRIAEPWRWDIVWQAVVATGAAIWML